MEEKEMEYFPYFPEGEIYYLYPELVILRNEYALRVLEILEAQGREMAYSTDWYEAPLIYIDEAVPANSSETSAWQQRLLSLCRKFNLPVYYGQGMAYRDAWLSFLDFEVIGADSDVMMVGGAWNKCMGFRFSPDEIAKMLVMEEPKWPVERGMIRKVQLKGQLSDRVDIRDVARALAERLKDIVHKDEVLEFDGNLDWCSHDKGMTLCGMMQNLSVRTALLTDSFNPNSSPDMVFDLSSVEPSIDVGEGRIVKMLSPRPVNAVWIGGMYGGTMEDIELAAKTLRGKKVASGVRLSVSPCTAEIYADAADRGYLMDIMEAGGMVLPQCASPREQARIGENELMVSNDNHNEKDYAGGTIYLSSTYKAIEAALTGYISLGASEEKAAEAPKADLPPKKKISQPVQPTESKAEEGPAVLRGRVWKFGDDIDTDIIMPTQHLSYADWEEVKRHLFEPLRPELAAKLSEGDIIVAGNNFGCGSSREQAAEAIATSGIRCIIAKSFARIFFRNAINNGVLLIECPELPDHVAEGDTVEVVINSHISHNGKTYAIPKMPENLYRLIKAGGLVKSVIGDSGQG